MTLYTYDFEVFRYDWLVVFKRASDGEYFIFHNDNAGVKKFMQEQECVVGGFNSKAYDCHILKGVCCGADNALVKEINDWIISGKQGYDHWFIKNNKFWFNHFDIRDDMQVGLSLKAIEGHLGMNIEETSVPFDIDRPLTDEELARTIHYCKHDVDVTEHLIKLRKDYLEGKISLGYMGDISAVKSMYSTNAKMTAMFLGAEQRPWTDERDYQYPTNTKRERIPSEVFEFFDKIHDSTIPSDEFFKMKLKLDVAGCEFVYGFGGIHGAIPGYQEEAKGTRIIRNYDVASLYPSLMIYCGYTSRNIKSASLYEKVYHDRLNAKKNGDKTTANTLKLCLNTTYGAMLNKYNGLYDPLMGRSVCISGQLFLTDLACGYLEKCKTVKIIQINTDGVMISFDESEYDLVREINTEWELRTRFTLEEDSIRKVVQKDVNNYIIVKDDGSTKVKGGYLSYGISKAGAWNINNNATILKKALAEYFANGVPVEETINNCNDIFEFQFIAKAGAKYRDSYHIVDGKKIPVQKVNRVYATRDERYGTLGKVKVVVSDDNEESVSSQKIESLPEHCIIDNDNHLTIEDVDKEFYIATAKKRVNDFLGIKEKKGRKTNMASTKKTVEKTTEGMTFLQKLFYLQTLMDEYDWEKDGKNMHQSYKFISEKQYKHNFKMARRKAGLLWECECLSSEYIPAISDKMHLVKGSFLGRLTDPDSGEFREYHFEGTGADNGDKALYKAYTGGLKFFLADQYLVAEGNDPEFDEEGTDNSAPSAPNMSTKPATEEERKEIKKDLTKTDAPATKLQIDQLKKSLKMLRDSDPQHEEFIQQIAEKTNNFTNISKSACEKLIITVGEMLDAGGEQ